MSELWTILLDLLLGGEDSGSENHLTGNGVVDPLG